MYQFDTFSVLLYTYVVYIRIRDREKKASKEVAHHQRASFNISRGVNEFSFPTLPPPRHPSLNETNSNFKWCWSARCSFWVLFEGKRLGLDQIHLPLIDGLSVKCVLVLYKTFLFFIRFCWILVKLLVFHLDTATSASFNKIWWKTKMFYM